MKKQVLLLGLLILQILSFGQNDVLQTVNHMKRELFNLNLANREDGVAGSPYLSEEFIKATFYQKNKPLIESSTRLNYFQSRFEFKIEDQLFVVDPESIDSVRMNDFTYVFKTFEIKGNSAVRAVERIGLSERGFLYKFIESIFKPEVKAIGYVEPKPASFEWEEPVYLIEIGNKLFVINNLNKVSTIAPPKEKEIKQFIKSNKIKKDDPSGLLKLLQYIDKLI